MTSVYFDTNALYIDGYRDSFVAGSLTFDQIGTAIGVRVLHGVEYLVEDAWSNFTRQDGSAFASVGDLSTYLTGQFSMRRAVGEAYGGPVVASADIGIGVPVAVSRATGQLMPARSDTYVLSFVAGLTIASVAQGFTATPARGAITLDDWTAQTGEVTLHVGVPYFLAPEGGLTVSPFGGAGLSSTRVGTGLTPTTLDVAPTDPILF